MRGYFPLIRKDSVTHMHGGTVYVKEGLPFTRDVPLRILIYIFNWLYFIQCFTSFSSINHRLDSQF